MWKIRMKGMCFLNTALGPSEGENVVIEKGFEQYAGIWNKYKQDSSVPVRAEIIAVYKSGFLL
jgi:hypothetical protein